jgi:hypothetical protein
VTSLRRPVEQLHGGIAGTNKVMLNKHPSVDAMFSQILKRLPKAWFKPVGQLFINKYNARFNGHLGPEWAGRNMVNIVYHVVISMYNFAHPCFDKTAPAQLQVTLLMKYYM